MVRALNDPSRGRGSSFGSSENLSHGFDEETASGVVTNIRQEFFY
jgi:hypothetical protein